MNKKFWIRFSVLLGIVVAILVLDLTTKYVLDATLSFSETKTIIPYLFNFKLVHNIGAAWGVLAGKQMFLIGLSLVFLSVFIVYYVKEKNKTWLLNITFGFLIGGCLGNLYDRIFIGYVRDFIQFAFWQSFPVFNFADVALTIGVVLFVIYLVLYFVRLKKEEKKAGISVENFDDEGKMKERKNAKKEKKDAKMFEENMKENIEKTEFEKNIEIQKNAKNTAKMQKNDSFDKENDEIFAKKLRKTKAEKAQNLNKKDNLKNEKSESTKSTKSNKENKSHNSGGER